MMLRTHLAITALAILLFLSHISGWLDKLVFVVIAVVATYIPDIDSAFSTIGRAKTARIIQFFVKHRGMFHSFTFCIAVSLLFAFIVPVLALPFFVGYGFHLLADSFTLEGIKPFWPYKRQVSWTFKTGSVGETGLFVSLLVRSFLR